MYAHFIKFQLLFLTRCFLEGVVAGASCTGETSENDLLQPHSSFWVQKSQLFLNPSPYLHMLPGLAFWWRLVWFPPSWSPPTIPYKFTIISFCSLSSHPTSPTLTCVFPRSLTKPCHFLISSLTGGGGAWYCFFTYPVFFPLSFYFTRVDIQENSNFISKHTCLNR